MITCSRRYFSASACGSSRVLMIGRLSVVSRPTSTSKKSARWLSWKPCSRPSWPMPTRPAPRDHLAGDEERRQVPHDVARTAWRAASGSSRGCRRTRPCRRCCSCSSTIGAPPGSWPARREASSITRSPALSQFTTSRGCGDLGRGVLRVGVVDVEPGAVGQDDVGQPEVLVGELAGVGDLRGTCRSRGRRAAATPPRSPSGPGGP